MLFTSLFDEKLLVPEEYIAATVGLWKKCQSLKGAAGTKRKCLISEYAAAKKKVESKIKFMKVQEGPKVPRDSSGSKSKGFVSPDTDVPSTSADEEEEPRKTLYVALCAWRIWSCYLEAVPRSLSSGHKERSLCCLFRCQM